MDQRKRQRIFIDPRVQGALVLRSVMYWVFCLVTITLLLMCWRIVTGPPRTFNTHVDEMWFQYGPVAVASLLLLPIIVVDTIRSSNRFVGPVFRLRRSMRQLVNGESVEKLQFRDGDYWPEIADHFNKMAARMQGQRCAEKTGSGMQDVTRELAAKD